MKAVTIKTKNVGEVKDCFKDINYQFSLEERNENYIKQELWIKCFGQ